MSTHYFSFGVPISWNGLACCASTLEIEHQDRPWHLFWHWHGLIGRKTASIFGTLRTLENEIFWFAAPAESWLSNVFLWFCVWKTVLNLSCSLCFSLAGLNRWDGRLFDSELYAGYDFGQLLLLPMSNHLLLDWVWESFTCTLVSPLVTIK